MKFESLATRLKSEKKEVTLLFRSIPGITLSLFALSLVGMNLLANKSIDFPLPYLALDAGILFSWVSFLAMDVIVKHFGVKGANEVAILGTVLNLFMCLIFFIASFIPGTWSFSANDPSIDIALDETFRGQWFVILGSTVSFLVSSIVNNVLSWLLGKAFKKDNAVAFYVRSYVSTSIAQFLDNFIFALMVSIPFFSWSIPQALTCAALGMVAELLMEIFFSPIGYAISKKWKKDNVGKEYFDYRNSKGENA